MGQRTLARVKGRQREEEEAEGSEEEEEGSRIAATLNNLTIEAVGTEDEAEEDLEAALRKEVE